MSATSRGALAIAALAGIFLAALAAGETAPAYGASFTVNATHDAVDATPGDGVCADAGGACTLRAAVMETNALPGADEITLPAGTYAITIAGNFEDAGEKGDLDIHGDVTLTGSGADATIIDGGFGGVGLQDRVMAILGPITVDLSNLTVRNGAGGIFNTGSLAIRTSTVKDNHAISDLGGGIRNEGSVTVLNTTLSGNTAISGGGGISNAGSLIVNGSEIMSNADTGIRNSGEATVTDTIVSGNTGREVGGIYNSGNMALSSSTIKDSPDIGVWNAATLSISASTISGNSQFGIFNDGPGSSTTLQQPAELSMVNSTISGNPIGIGNFGSAMVTNSTFAGSGISVLNQSDGVAINAKNVIFGNAGGSNCSAYPDPSVPVVTSLGHNLDSDGSCHLSGPSDVSNVDPKLGPLADNGGPTQTHAPLEGSPAIDAGDNGACPATDQRGVARPQGTACDIGAYESSFTRPSSTPAQLPTTGGATTGDGASPIPAIALAALPTLALAAGATAFRRRARRLP